MLTRDVQHPVVPAGDEAGEVAAVLVGEVAEGAGHRLVHHHLAELAHDEEGHDACQGIAEQHGRSGHLDGLGDAQEQAGADGAAQRDQLDMAVFQAALERAALLSGFMSFLYPFLWNADGRLLLVIDLFDRGRLLGGAGGVQQAALPPAGDGGRPCGPAGCRAAACCAGLVGCSDLQGAALDLVALQRFEQGLEVAFAEAVAVVAWLLDELEEHRAEQGLGEDLQQQARLAAFGGAVQQDAARLQLVDRLAVARQALLQALVVEIVGAVISGTPASCSCR